MSVVFMPQGLKLDKHDVGMARQDVIPNAFPSGFSPHSFFRGTPVKLNNVGNIEPISSANDIIYGIFTGIQYIDANSQRPVNQPYYIANSPIGSGTLVPGLDIQLQIYLYTSPDIIFQAQFTGALARSPLGSQFNFDATTTTVTQADGSVFPEAGNTTPLLIDGTAPYGGYSYASLDPTFVDPAIAGQVVCVGMEQIVLVGGNEITNGFPIVKVKVNISATKASLVQPDYESAS